MKTSLSIIMITGNNCAEFVKQFAHFWAASIREERGFMLLLRKRTEAFPGTAMHTATEQLSLNTCSAKHVV